MSAPAAPVRTRPAARRLVPLVVGGTPAPPALPAELLSLRGRVVIISATVGQGHEGAARELARRLTRRGVQVEVHDYLDALPVAARRVLRDLYGPTVQYAPAVFDRMFHGLEGQGAVRRLANWVCRQAEATVAGWTEGADVVVTTYPLGGQTLGALREQGRLDAPAVTYLTDPAAHATWCHPAVDHHLTVIRATAVDAARYGVRARPSGPLAASANHRRDRSAVRAELGLPDGAPVALISAGSLGMGSVPRTVRDLIGHPDLRVVVLCGRNERLRRRLGRLPRVVALGWRDDVPSLMGACDVLVHNAGGLSLTEALAAGLPAITYRPIPGHGRANADVLDRSGVAPWPRDGRELVAAVDAVAAGRATTSGGGGELWPIGADPAAVVHDILAVLAAALLGASSVAQRRGMLVSPGSDDAPSRGLLPGLVSSRWWWAGTFASVGGLVLQFLALTMGSLIVVQTTMVSSIAATTLAEWLLLGRRPGSAGWAGMTLTATGLVGVLWVLAPTGTGASTPTAGVMATLGAVGLGVLGAAALRVRTAAGGGLALAAATGLGYGITAVALKTVGSELAHGWSAPLAQPALWVAVLLGPAAVLLSQHALQRARRVAAAVSLIVVVDPIVGLFAGAAWFGERFTTTAGSLAVAVVAAGSVVVGIAIGHSTPEPVVGRSRQRHRERQESASVDRAAHSSRQCDRGDVPSALGDSCPRCPAGRAQCQGGSRPGSSWTSNHTVGQRGNPAAGAAGPGHRDAAHPAVRPGPGHRGTSSEFGEERLERGLLAGRVGAARAEAGEHGVDPAVDPRPRGVVAGLQPSLGLVPRRLEVRHP